MRELIVYMASRTEEENHLILRRLEPLHQDFPGLKFIGLHPQGLPLVARERVDVMVMNVMELTAADVVRVREIRAGGFSGPILVVARSGAGLESRQLSLMVGVVHLEKPYETRDLLGILGKMLNARMVAQRVHRRYDTNEVGAVEFYGKNERFPSRVRNISKGGAYLQMMSPVPLRTGDMVRLTVELNHLNRSYVVAARVVWTKASKETDPPAVGVEFVGSPDMRNSMT